MNDCRLAIVTANGELLPAKAPVREKNLSCDGFTAGARACACLCTGICSQQSALAGLIRCEEVGCKGPLFQTYP